MRIFRNVKVCEITPPEGLSSFNLDNQKELTWVILIDGQGLHFGEDVRINFLSFPLVFRTTSRSTL